MRTLTEALLGGKKLRHTSNTIELKNFDELQEGDCIYVYINILDKAFSYLIKNASSNTLIVNANIQYNSFSSLKDGAPEKMKINDDTNFPIDKKVNNLPIYCGKDSIDKINVIVSTSIDLLFDTVNNTKKKEKLFILNK